MPVKRLIFSFRLRAAIIDKYRYISSNVIASSRDILSKMLLYPKDFATLSSKAAAIHFYVFHISTQFIEKLFLPDSIHILTDLSLDDVVIYFRHIVLL